MSADLALALVVVAGFALGFFRGVVRQLLALGAWAVIFVAAAHLRVPLGDWLASSSPEYGLEYATMLAFAVLFIAGFGVALVLVEFGGAPSKLARHPVIDDLLGAALGVVLAIVVLGALMAVMDTYFGRFEATGRGEIGWLREMHRAIADSTIGRALDEWVVRGMGMLLGPLLPADVRNALA